MKTKTPQTENVPAVAQPPLVRLLGRLEAYLTTGGAFNPELADHMAVRDLLIDCRDALTQTDAALDLLAGWCDAVKNGGSGWDDWDEWYKDACYRPGPLRELIDARMVRIAAENDPLPNK